MAGARNPGNGAGVPISTFSVTAGTDGGVTLEWTAVVRMALYNSIMFCCFFGPPETSVRAFFSVAFWESDSDVPISWSPSASTVGFVDESSAIEGSAIGHINPVLGV